MPIFKANRLRSTVYSSSTKLASIIVIILIISAVSSLSSVVKSVTPLEQAQQDYSFQSTKYQAAKEKYENAKANYKTYNTTTAKNEAFLKTQDYLIQINNVYITYLLLINERSNLYDWGKGIYVKNDEHKIIDDEIKSLENLRSEAQNLKTLEETVTYALKLKSHVENETLPSAYKLLVKTDITQLLEVQYDFEQTAAKVENYSADKISDSNRQLFLNWQSQVKTITEEARSQIDLKKDDANKAISNPTVKYNQTSYSFESEKEREQFKQTPGLLRELVNII